MAPTNLIGIFSVPLICFIYYALVQYIYYCEAGSNVYYMICIQPLFSPNSRNLLQSIFIAFAEYMLPFSYRIYSSLKSMSVRRVFFFFLFLIYFHIIKCLASFHDFKFSSREHTQQQSFFIVVYMN